MTSGMKKMDSKCKVFLFVGSAAYSNRGCEAIVRGTVDILSKKMTGSRFIISTSVDDFPADGFEKEYGLEYRVPLNTGWDRRSRFLKPKWWIRRILLRPLPRLTYEYVYSVQLRAMEESDCALRVGGDIYTLDYGSLGYLLKLDKTLLSTDKPLVLWGASVGPFEGNSNVKNRIQKHLNKFSLILARESETVGYLSSLGIESNVRLVADPAFCMAPLQPALDKNMMNFLNEKPVGINLSAFAGKFSKNHNERTWRENAKECVTRLLQAKMGPVLLVPHVFKDGNDDYKFLESVKQDLAEWDSQVEIMPRNLSAPQIKWVIGQTRLFAGARTHSTIASLSSHIPTLSLGYSMKATGINKDIFGDLSWLLPVSSLRPDEFVKKMNELNSNRESIKEHLQKVIPTIQERALSAGDYVAELLENR
jgi:colanic acid/amylovoran biosynthesis protein